MTTNDKERRPVCRRKKDEALGMCYKVTQLLKQGMTYREAAQELGISRGLANHYANYRRKKNV